MLLMSLLYVTRNLDCIDQRRISFMLFCCVVALQVEVSSLAFFGLKLFFHRFYMESSYLSMNLFICFDTHFRTLLRIYLYLPLLGI